MGCRSPPMVTNDVPPVRRDAYGRQVRPFQVARATIFRQREDMGRRTPLRPFCGRLTDQACLQVLERGDSLPRARAHRNDELHPETTKAPFREPYVSLSLALTSRPTWWSRAGSNR
jgi:hypothetical protein